MAFLGTRILNVDLLNALTKLTFLLNKVLLKKIKSVLLLQMVATDTKMKKSHHLKINTFITQLRI